MPDGDDLRRGDPVLISALAAGTTHADAAAQAGVSVATVTRRLREPEFRADVLEARARMVEQSVGLLAAATADAAATLRRLLHSPQDAVALAAARTILEQTIRITEHVVLEQRVADLEDVAEHVAAGAGLRSVG